MPSPRCADIRTNAYYTPIGVGVVIPCGKLRICEILVAADKTFSSTSFVMSCHPPTCPSGARLDDNAKIHFFLNMGIFFLQKSFLTPKGIYGYSAHGHRHPADTITVGMPVCIILYVQRFPAPHHRWAFEQ